MCKRLAALALALLTLLSLPAMAAEEVPVPITVHAQCWNSHVYVCEDGKKFFMGAIDAAGHVRSSLTYNGTVYVPLRTAGLWLGADAVWTAETAAARLTTGQFKSFLKADYDEQRDNYNVFQARTETMQRQEELERTRGMDVELRPDVTLLLDGAPQHFQNAQGEPIYPIRWNDEVWGDEL